MRLGIDLDGVVADFNAGWMRLHTAEFGSELDPAMVDSWDGLHQVGGFADMGEFWRWASPQPHRRSIFRYLDPYPGAVEALRGLERDGHRIVVVSTKPSWARSDTYGWLADHEIPTTEIHLVARKSDVECDVYLDDAPHVLDELTEHRPAALVCRWVRPWNDPVTGVRDVEDWPDFRRELATRTTSLRTAG